ncbi:PilW family protein [Gammaproteobacteria bacterium]|nr:PilW family protein [Gammaproteobacteria bacterium]
MRGFTLIEALVGIAISSAMMSALLLWTIDQRALSMTLQAANELHRGGTMALRLLQNELRVAGFSGCAAGQPLAVTRALDGGDIDDFRQPIESRAASSSYWLPSGRSDQTQSYRQSDAITLRYIDPRQRSTLSHEASGEIPIRVDAQQLETEETVLIGDCHGAELLSITGRSGNQLTHTFPANTSDALAREHGPSTASRLMPIRAVRLFLRRSVSGIPSLWQSRLQVGGDGVVEVRNDLIEGIERMVIRYGLDLDNDGAIEQWRATLELDQRPLAIAVALVIRSINPAGQVWPSRQFTLLDQTWRSPADRYLRRPLHLLVPTAWPL